MTLVAGCLLWPSRAQALPNPLAAVFVLDLLFQLAVVSVLVGPVGSQALRRFVRRWFPSRHSRALVVTGVVGAATLVLLALVPRPPFRLSRPAMPSPCQPLDAATAALLGLPEGAFVLDPRPADLFDSYHLIGSCRASVRDLARSEPIRKQLRQAKAPVLLIEDDELTPERFFKGIGRLGLDEVHWGMVPGGLEHYYERDGREAGWGVAPNLVVDSSGASVSQQLGPFWASTYTSVAGGLAAWRQVPESAVAWALEAGVPTVDLRVDVGREDWSLAATPSSLVVLPKWDAYLEALEARLGRRVDELLVLCRYSEECLGGEALARQLASRGGRLYGYVRSGRPLEQIVAAPYFLDAWWRALGQLVIGALLGAGLVLGGTVIVRRLRSYRFGRRLASLAVRLAPLGGFALFALLAATTDRFLSPSLAPSLFTTTLFDMRKVGLGAPLALLPVLLVAVVHLGESALFRPSRALRLGVPLLGVVLLAMEGPRPMLSLLTGFDLLLACAVVGGAWAAVVWKETPHTFETLDPTHADRLVPLAKLPLHGFAGAKAGWLAVALREGCRVPDATVLLTRPERWTGRLDEVVLAKLRKRLGHGLVVVRSSAPDEDDGAATPGRYVSVGDVPADDALALGTAIQQVLSAYLDRGIAPDASVAVLVQKQVEGRLAGVAVREPSWRGAGLLVEASEGRNVDVTAGYGAQRRERLGRFARAWLLGGIRVREMNPWAFADFISRLETRFPGGRVDVEWSWDRHGPMLLQVRHAPDEKAPECPHAAAGAVDALAPALAWSRGKAARVALDATELSEFQGTSQATVDILSAMWDGPPRRAAARLLGLRVDPIAARPAVMRLGSTVYANRTTASPVRVLLSMPAARMFRWLSRFRVRRVLGLLEEKLRELEDAPPPSPAPPSTSAAAAADVLEARARLLGGPATVAVAIARLQPWWQAALARLDAASDGDPLLRALAAGAAPEALRRDFPDRALPDLALERPRFDDSRAPMTAVAASAAAVPNAVPEALAMLRGRARVVMARHAVALRRALLVLGERTGRDDVFEWSLDELRVIAAGGDAPTPRFVDSSTRGPPRLTMGALELWAAGNSPPEAGFPSAKGVWIGSPREVVATVTHQSPPPSGHVLVVDVPAVDLVASLPEGALLVAASGSALCHAALVARQRAALALFGVGGEALSLAPGDRVKLTMAGRVLRVD